MLASTDARAGSLGGPNLILPHLVKLSELNVFAKSARRYAERGLFVFPVFGVKGNACACPLGPRCDKSPGKHPMIQGGLSSASNEVATIDMWAAMYPDANIGIATGQSELVVLDVDPRHGGNESLKKLAEQVPELKSAWVARTGSGGWHYYFKANPEIEVRNSAGKLGAGLDIRGVGGYVLAPTSRHVAGGSYEWKRFEGDLPMVPTSLTDLIQSASPSMGASKPIGDELIPEGSRNDALYRLGASLRAKGLDGEEIYAALSVINVNRCSPPIEDEELRRIVERVSKYSPGEIWGAYNEYVHRKIERSEHASDKADNSKGRKTLKLTKFKDIQHQDVDWLMPGYLAAGKFTLMFGMEGRGKSYATIGIAASISRGDALPGVDMPMGVTPGDVLLITYEDNPEDTIKPRLMKCGADMNRIHTVHYSDGLVSSDDMDALEQAIDSIKDLRLVIIDPITSFIGSANENSESEVRMAINPLVQMAFKRKFAILGIKHANKDEKLSISNRVSGSRAWTALARNVILVGYDNEKEQEQYHTYGGIVAIKGNLSGSFAPLSYEIDNGVFRWIGRDYGITPERLMPKPPEKKPKE